MIIIMIIIVIIVMSIIIYNICDMSYIDIYT